MPMIANKTIIVLGGWGLVGRAICHELLKQNPRRIVICSLKKSESHEAVSDLKKEIVSLNETSAKKISTRLIPEWGDIFMETALKDMNIRTIRDPKILDKIIDQTFNDLSKISLNKNFLYRLVAKYKPDIVIDAVNTATGVAYRDVYASVLDVRLRMSELESMKADDPAYAATVQKLLSSLRLHLTSISLPRLIRHVQILYTAMKKVGTEAYFKIGTTGTGGMGLNIPYTHSEEKPSQKLLTKSAVGGAHSLLLFLMNNTPGFAFTKELKPAAAIAWKSIDYGEIGKGGQSINLFDNDPKKPFKIDGKIELRVADDDRIEPLNKPLKAVYIHTGENGLFSTGEFEAITTTGQMEYVTPEEIARAAKEEILGSNTGYDIIGALSNTVMISTYRAGVMRELALDRLRQLQDEHGEESVAFEILGPPRLSKLLYETYLIKKAYKSFDKALKAKPEQMSRKIKSIVAKDAKLRSQILSIGIPILLPDGKSMLRGPQIVIPPDRGCNTVELKGRDLDQYCGEGWVDLRKSNMEMWQKRLKMLKSEMDSMSWRDTGEKANSSSRINRKRYEIGGNGERTINIGEVVGWIFNIEEEGSRKTFTLPRFKVTKS